MCGIVGVVSTKIDVEAFKTGLKALEHRGPDNEELFSEELAGKKIFFGHRRLSIIDLSDAGNQPMHVANISMVYNGEVYNFKELRETYLQNVQLNSSSDSEVLLHLYAMLGPGFVKLLNGDFAIAFLNRTEQTISLFRDRFGVKPLYVYQSGKTFAFASEIKAFREMGLQLTLNKEEVGRYLVYKYSPGQNTLFNEVSRVAPASFQTYQLASEKVSEEVYWALDYHHKFKDSYSEAKFQLKHFFSQSVSRRLIADVPIANYLSGGVDSSIIAYHLKDRENTHFCAVKKKSDLAAEGTTSDGYYAKKLASEWKLNLVEIEIGKEQLTKELIRQAVSSCDDLIADGSAIPAMLIAKQASKNYKVVLSGMGADEIFFGYNGHFLLQMDSMAAKIPGFKSLIQPLLKNIEPGKGAFKAYKRYLKKWGDNHTGSYNVARFSIVGDVQSAISLSRNKPEMDYLFSEWVKNENSFENLMNFELKNFLVKNNSYLDRTSMAYGLESRVPYLDHEFVEFVSSLPTEWKIDWKLKSKKILKEAYADVLPQYITRRRKAGFGMPLRSLFSTEAVIENLLDRELLTDLEIIDMAFLDALIVDHGSGIADHSALLYAVVCFQEWYKIFFLEKVSPSVQKSLISQ